jgi:hypothetical protein
LITSNYDLITFSKATAIYLLTHTYQLTWANLDSNLLFSLHDDLRIIWVKPLRPNKSHFTLTGRTPISSIQCHLLKLFLYHQKWKTNFKAGQLSICYIIQRVLKTQARNIVYSFPCSFSRSLSPIGLKARGKEQTELLDIFVHVWLSRGNWWGKIFLSELYIVNRLQGTHVLLVRSLVDFVSANRWCQKFSEPHWPEGRW